jgi:ATP-dependent DNA helicase RecG
MNVQELKTRLNDIEWNDAEFKEAKHEVPKSAYETVSALANTSGGWLIFGVRQAEGAFEICGVADPERIQNDFLSALHADNKVNHDVRVKEKLIKHDGKTVLAFYIPESARVDKPIYLNGDIRRSFVRRGGGDYQCSLNEIGRFLRDASTERWDGGVFNFPLKEAFNPGSLKWYRARFNELNPGHDAELSTMNSYINGVTC